MDVGREGEPEVDVLSGTDLVPDESVASVVAGPEYEYMDY